MRALLVLAATLFPAFLAATWQTASANPELSLSVSPETVNVGLNFTGDDVHIYGAAPDGADVVVTVDGPTKAVKVSKKGKVLGIFWMTVDRAEVEDMPSFHLVRSSDELDKILSSEEQIRLGVDPMSTSIMSQAQAVNPSNDATLSQDKAAEFIAGLRDMYIRDGFYAPCVNCHRAPPEASTGHMGATAPSDGVIHLEDGQWETVVSLPWDTPLGDYTVDCYWVKSSQVVMSDSTTFTVKKAGLVDSLGSLAKNNGAVYGAMTLGIIIAMGMAIGFIFPRRRAGH
jgi:hypothetical protein